METGRQSFLQAKKFTSKMLDEYQKPVANNDINKYSEFHDGDENHKQELYEEKNYEFKLVTQIYEQPLKLDVVLDDLFRVLLRRIPKLEGCDEFDYTAESFENEPEGALAQAQEYYEENMKRLKELFEQYQKDKLVKKSSLAI